MTARQERTRRRGRTRLRTRSAHRGARQAQAAFDLLHLRHATAFTRQAYLLCGHPRTAERAVAHAFRTAWKRWPEVAADRDPAGWIRAVAHDYALSPWHLLAPGRSTRPPHPGPAADRALLNGLLALPRPHRRTLLLHDGLGLDAARTAVETEASTAAAASRLAHARDLLTAEVPELRRARAERRVPLLAERLGLLLRAATVPPPPPAAAARTRTARTVRAGTGAALGATGALAAAVGLALLGQEHRAAAPGEPAAVVDAGQRTHGAAYLPGLRSANTRMRLTEHGGAPVARPVDDTGPVDDSDPVDDGAPPAGHEG
ncbi:RNA polymerase sigma factor [Streptomyces sp. TR06-5]|uniref:RNA polymerase sigma factor n=1 Tax=unclassified Streptomyces TaxID=2593676 RepID=UPI0039A05A78